MSYLFRSETIFVIIVAISPAAIRCRFDMNKNVQMECPFHHVVRLFSVVANEVLLCLETMHPLPEVILFF